MLAPPAPPSPIALTIAGSDSGGGAGIQADLKTFHRFGAFGTSVVTAITAQNTLGVTGWQAVPPELVRSQLDAVATDLRPRAIKSGMLGDRRVVHAVGDGVVAHRLRPYVLDPVMVATSGDLLLERDAVEALRGTLVPLATLVTPNLDEAAILVGHEVADIGAMEAAARALVERMGAGAALVKGGHLDADDLVDVLFLDGAIHHFRHERVGRSAFHGTGCTLSAAITARLAHGDALGTAVAAALAWLREAIRTAPGLGAGHSPLNHFA